MNEAQPKRNKKEEKTRKNKSAKQNSVTSKRGFNFLDALIIISILATVALIVLVYSPLKLFNIKSNDATIIYSINISGVPAEYASSISVSDIVTDDKGYNLGLVASDVQVEPHVIYEYRENQDGSGSIIEIIHPDLVDLIITVSANAEVADDGYIVDGKRIALEAEYNIVLPEFEAKGVCISLSEESAKEAGALK